MSAVIIHTEHFRADGMHNVVTGLGESAWDPYSGLRLSIDGATLQRNAQTQLVRRYGLLRKAVYNIPEAATAEWGKPVISDGSQEEINKLEEALKKIPVTRIQDTSWAGRRMAGGARTAFREGLVQTFRTGNGALILDVDDGQEIDQPIAYNRIKEIRRIWVASRWRISPDLTQIASDGSYLYYWLYGAGDNISFRQQFQGSRIHYSRVLWIQGVEDDSAYNQGCDVSILEPLIDAFTKFYSGIEGAGRMIVDFDVIVHKIEGYLETLMTGGEAAEQKFKERIRANMKARSVYRGHIIDKDGEEISHDTRQVGGYSDLLDQLKTYLLGSTDYPPAVLFGEFSSGIDASGRTQEEKQLWNETIGRCQRNKLDHLITGDSENSKGILVLLALSKQGPTNGKVPKGLSWQWNPVYRPTPEEQAQLEEMRAGVIQTLSQVDPRFAPNALLSHYGGSEYNPTITLTEEYIEALQEEAKETEKPELEEAAAPLKGQAAAFPPRRFGREVRDSEDIFINRSDKQDSQTITIPLPLRQIFRSGVALNRKRRTRRADINAVRRAKAIARGQTLTSVEIAEMMTWLEKNKRYERSEIGSEDHTAWMLYGGSEALKWMKSLRHDSIHKDDATRSKRIIPFHDFKIGLQYQPWDWRHGKRLPVGYGHLRLTRSPDDGMCVDVYVGPHLESGKVWAVSQLVNGEFDEMKYFIGFDEDSGADDIKQLYSRIMAPEMFGGVKESSLAELKQFLRTSKC